MSEPRAVHYRMEELEVDHPMPLISRRRVLSERMMISEVVLEAGCVVPSHQHANEQIAYVISGRLRFGLGQEGTDDHRTLEVGAV